ncbi:MAG: IS3 family transposase [Flavobacteriales bacterium]
MSRAEQRLLVVRGHDEFTIGEQCALIGLSRSTLYYKPRPASEEDLRIMRLMDELHLEDPTRGTRRLCDELVDLGIRVGRDKVRTLMRRMRMACVYRRPRTTVFDKAKYKHPYLLRGLKIERAHQAWGIDITYIPMRGGYMYMCAIIDLYSRYIVGWSISNTMEAEWVCAVVRDAVAAHGKPEIINSDQGSQFTSDEYQKLFKEGQPCEGVRISMDGKGRAIDNVFIERFWRTLKHEHIYLQPPEDGVDLCRTCSQFIHFYNHRRKHSGIGKVPPAKRLPLAA